MNKIRGVVYKRLGRRKAYGLVEDGDDIIYIDPRLKGRKQLEILIHEALHILRPESSEEDVINDSVELTKMLWKQGFRRVDNDRSHPFQSS